MGDYLVLHWPRGAPGEEGVRLRQAILARGDWALVHDAYQLCVFTRGPRPPRVQALARRGGVVIGDLFDSAAAKVGEGRDFPLAVLAGLSPRTAARALVDGAFGRYVAVLVAGMEPPFLLRDPTGGLEALTWRRGAVSVMASTVEPGAVWAPPNLAIDWPALVALLARNNLWSQICPLVGVTAIDAGTLRSGPGATFVERLWRPGDGARAKRYEADPQALVRVVDGCVAALAKDRRAILVEISGGLDSAIVATSLASCAAPVVAAVNYYWPQPEGDERVWARRIADACGYPLDTSLRTLLRVDGDKLARHALAPRPGLNAQDPDLDHDIAEAAARHGADALFSGQGGDGVFYQMGNLALASDIVAGKAAPFGKAASLAALARRSRTTVWSLLARSLLPMARTAPGIGPPSFLAEGVSVPPPHAWIADRRGVSRAKQIQIRGLTNIQNAFGDSLRGRAAQLSYPLMAQPVIEHCLAIPAPLLAIGDVDRPFARRAFAERLPPESLARRSKGEVSVFFAKSVAASLPALRPYLLEGRLVGAGLINPAKLEPLLHPEPMIWRDSVGEILLAAYLEAWVRVWEERLGAS